MAGACRASAIRCALARTSPKCTAKARSTGPRAGNRSKKGCSPAAVPGGIIVVAIRDASGRLPPIAMMKACARHAPRSDLRNNG